MNEMNRTFMNLFWDWIRLHIDYGSMSLSNFVD